MPRRKTSPILFSDEWHIHEDIFEIGMKPTSLSRATARLRPLLAAFVILSLACDDGTSPPDVTGRYQLETVNDQPVPYRWSDGPFSDEWLDEASITLRSDGAFLSVAEWRTTYANGNPDSRITYPVEGTYRVRNGDITFFADGEVWATGSVGDEPLLTLIGDNFVEHVYRK